MIRKWFKINSCFVDVLKNSLGSHNLEKKWAFDTTSRQFLSCCSLYCSRHFTDAFHSASTGHLARQLRPFHGLSDPSEKGDAESVQLSDSDDVESAVAETPARTELFEVKGPGGSAFLIEVRPKDLDEVKMALVRLKGDFFHFDKTVIEWFTMKCILTGKRAVGCSRDEQRLAKIHAISSGSEEVYYGTGKYFFVSSVDKTMQSKRILERLGYKISEIMYRFQPKEKVSLNDTLLDVCNRFVEAVQVLPEVISVTHNL